LDLHVQDTDLRQVLRLLSTQGKKNLVATKEVTGKVTADLYNVTFKEALEAVLSASGYVYEEKGGFIYVYTAKQLQTIREAARAMAVKVFNLSFITAADAKVLITPALSKEGSISVTPAAAMGIPSAGDQSGGNTYATADMLVVRDYEDQLRRIAELVREIDVKPEQVLIEATILQATLTEDDALGVEFTALAGIDFESLSSSSDLGSVETGTVSGETFKKPRALFRTEVNSAVPAGGFTFGLISNELSLFIRALESVTDVTVLANPKLLVLNKQRGEVLVGQREGYVTTTFTETTATQSVEFLETGTRLVVRPYIARNGYIRLEIHPEDSSGSVEQIGAFALPKEKTTEMTSNVLIQDGHTIVMGGLFRESTQNGRAQIPVLGNLPYVGALFRRTVDETGREEVIILVTPRIIRQEADEATSEHIKDDTERFRIGQRKGLQWWGRGRLAQAHLRWAKQWLAQGDQSKAMWDLEMALSMSPRIPEAVRLMEHLTNKAYWSDQARYSSIKYVIQQMIMAEMGKPVERIIPPRKPLSAQDVEPDVRKAFGIRQRPEDPPAQLLVSPNAKPLTEQPAAEPAKVDPQKP